MDTSATKVKASAQPRKKQKRHISPAAAAPVVRDAPKAVAAACKPGNILKRKWCSAAQDAEEVVCSACLGQELAPHSALQLAMVRCASCGEYTHRGCLGLEASSKVPKGFVCPLCALLSEMKPGRLLLGDCRQSRSSVSVWAGVTERCLQVPAAHPDAARGRPCYGGRPQDSGACAQRCCSYARCVHACACR